MKFIGNVLWLFLTGLWTGLMWFFIGIVWCITVVGIPFGLQAFKFAKLSFWPMGKKVTTHFGKHPIANIIWFILGGFGLMFSFIGLGIVWCITIIGIPFGKQAFKFAKLAICPFGATVEAPSKKTEETAAEA